MDLNHDYSDQESYVLPLHYSIMCGGSLRQPPCRMLSTYSLLQLHIIIRQQGLFSILHSGFSLCWRVAFPQQPTDTPSFIQPCIWLFATDNKRTSVYKKRKKRLNLLLVATWFDVLTTTEASAPIVYITISYWSRLKIVFFY